MAPLTPLVGLVHNRWAIPVLAHLHRDRGAKAITLVHRLSISRDSLRRTLDALGEAGLVIRNPGHGHPLRPEYILTPHGTRAGGAAAPLEAALRPHGSVAYKKWSLPTLFVLASGSVGFNPLKRQLAPATARAVSLTLKELGDAGLIDRTVEDTHPPSVRYALSTSAVPLAEEIAALAQAL
jgi:DNA-binding HxlR family transcriptional regulator